MKKLLSICAVTALLCSNPVTASESVYLMVKASAIHHGVPTDFAVKIAKHESGLRCNAVGSSGERGPLQILPSTARGLGYKNIRSSSCATQIDAGMKHLAICYRGVRGNRWLAAGCHNQGFSVIKRGRLGSAARRYANAVTGLSGSLNPVKTPLTRTRKSSSLTVTPVADKIPGYRTNFTAGKAI